MTPLGIALPWTELEGRALHRYLLATGTSVAVAESLTVGHVQCALGRWSGASGYLAGGITAYSLAQKIVLLGVDAEHSRAVNAVSEQVATEMARGVARLMRAEWGLATTGYAEPDPARGVATTFAWVAVVRGPRVWTARVEGSGLDRLQMQIGVAGAVLRLWFVVAEQDDANGDTRATLADESTERKDQG